MRTVKNRHRHPDSRVTGSIATGGTLGGYGGGLDRKQFLLDLERRAVRPDAGASHVV